jgi:hypothetical protein
MENYKPNSHKSKQEAKEAGERQKLEKVVKGTAKVKKKSEIRKFADVFISEDVTNVKSYIFSDVLVPAVKKLISDIVQDGVEMFLFGGARRDGKRSKGYRADYVSYNDYSGRRDSRRHVEEPRSRSAYRYDEIVLETRGEAEDVLTRMDELIDMYGSVAVADLYDLVGITGNYTDNKYGWTNIRNAEAVRVRDGYVLKLPKALPLD